MQDVMGSEDCICIYRTSWYSYCDAREVKSWNSAPVSRVFVSAPSSINEEAPDFDSALMPTVTVPVLNTVCVESDCRRDV
jgi:hypothetical protein